jgi:hypothetical protein
MRLLPESMPMERQASLMQIANALFKVAWKYEGGVGKAPPFDSLNARNQKRWVGAALACEHLMSQAKQDAVQQRAVINTCIRTLEQMRDANDRVEIK